MKYGYYPGCSGAGTSKEYDASSRAVIRALGLEFTDIEDWSCCGSTPAHSIDTVLSGALAARNLVQATKIGADAVVTPCPSCLSNLKLARHRMQQDEFRAKVDSLLDAPTPAELPDTVSLLQVLLEQVGVKDVATRVTRKLEGVKVACYYGCLMSRPPEVMQFDDPENPMALDTIMTALGAEVVPFPLKTECCGASFGISRRDITGNLTGRILESAKAFGADAVVTACPLCHMNLDLRQIQAERTTGEKFAMPVFYFTQLMGYCFGLDGKDLMLEKLVVSPEAFLTKVTERREESRKKDAAKQEAPAKAAKAPEKAVEPVAETAVAADAAETQDQGAAS